MSLEDVYNKQVRHDNVGIIPTIGSAPPPTIERDPIIRQLEIDVFKQLQAAIPTVTTNTEVVTQPEIKHVTFEDALKELSQMTK